MSQLNPLNDLSKVYLDQVAKINQQDEANDIKRWEEGEKELQQQMETSAKELATLGAPQMEEEVSYVESYVTQLNKTLVGSPMEEEKKAAKDYDGDGKVESGKDEYFGSKDKAIKKAMGKKVKEEVEEVDEAMSSYDKARKAAARRAADRNAARRRGEMGGRMERETYTNEAGRQMHHKGYRAEAKRLSNWRDDLSDLIEVAPMTDVEMEKEVKEKKVNNKVVINPKMSEAVAQIGGEVISETEVDLQEKQKDTPDQVKAVIAFDRARKGTDDATYDSMHGKKKQAKKERDYAKWQRDKGAEDAQKSGHRWKHAKGSTREKEGKKSETHAYIKDSFAVEGYGKKKKHNCASKVKHEEFGIGICIKGMHTINEHNMVTHYDVEFAEYIVENCPVEELEILVSETHMHKEMKEGVVSKEVKALQKAGKTLKDTPVVKADNIDTPNYKGQKFGVKEDDDWIQKAVKRPGAFTRKAKAAGQSVQQFAKTVDDNPGKYSTRTKKQANLAQTFASMKKEDVEELFYTLIAE